MSMSVGPTSAPIPQPGTTAGLSFHQPQTQPYGTQQQQQAHMAVPQTTTPGVGTGTGTGGMLTTDGSGGQAVPQQTVQAQPGGLAVPIHASASSTGSQSTVATTTTAAAPPHPSPLPQRGYSSYSERKQNLQQSVSTVLSALHDSKTNPQIAQTILNQTQESINLLSDLENALSHSIQQSRELQERVEKLSESQTNELISNLTSIGIPETSITPQRKQILRRLAEDLGPELGVMSKRIKSIPTDVSVSGGGVGAPHAGGLSLSQGYSQYNQQPAAASAAAATTAATAATTSLLHPHNQSFFTPQPPPERQPLTGVAGNSAAPTPPQFGGGGTGLRWLDEQLFNIANGRGSSNSFSALAGDIRR